ncbi:related to aromatic amino acid aminotransferase and related proteins [Ramularia collo-cygni]|uniref:Related to aromatic amino acid aminotransferase and related proteins n=1 Tax=Ramularia collo-cygni TaxID=112498 RepID=A0A2D3V408_9PEZI|nr:related to aromatic amino acid aminotransferase and related proteins [Ramularia collo-cygni]CZT16239.1 related to aromatic amino acid aminotransferase and related proteins [Ramularia collo-cygni]
MPKLARRNLIAAARSISLSITLHFPSARAVHFELNRDHATTMTHGDRLLQSVIHRLLSPGAAIPRTQHEMFSTQHRPFEGLLDLQKGWPSARLCARKQICNGVEDVLAEGNDMTPILGYGPSQGYAPLRNEIAKWLSDVYALSAEPTEASRICVTNGASASLANVVLKFTDPSYTRRVFMVEPTYFLACPIFEDCGFRGRLQGVPEGSQDGIDLDFLLNELSKTESESGWPDQPATKTGVSYPHVYKYVLYCTTTFANPSAKTMPPDVRERLVEIARAFDILLISDDVYDFLSWPASDSLVEDSMDFLPARLVDIDRSLPGTTPYGNAISNGSFSKIVGPGIRVGWVEAQPDLVMQLAQIGSSRSGGNPAHFASTIVEHMLRTGSLQSHISDVAIPEYHMRYYVYMKAVEELLIPLGYVDEAPKHTSGIAGGFFSYLRTPRIFAENRVYARDLAAIALRDYNLRVAFGHMFVIAGDAGSLQRAELKDGFGYCIRLCWAWMETGEILEALNRLADCSKTIRAKLEIGEDVTAGLSPKAYLDINS